MCNNCPLFASTSLCELNPMRDVACKLCLRDCAMTVCRKDAKCQPNFRQHVSPAASQSCGPYHPLDQDRDSGSMPVSPIQSQIPIHRSWPSRDNHDTIAMVAIDMEGNIAAGASSNGASHKVSEQSPSACPALVCTHPVSMLHACMMQREYALCEGLTSLRYMMLCCKALDCQQAASGGAVGSWANRGRMHSWWCSIR